jgi:GNAT superfamily N-acetyltransferase
MNFKFVAVTPQNAAKEGFFCIKNPKYPGFQLKLEWLSQRNQEGLKLVLLKVEGETVGFIEYVPGKFAWRPVKAENYLFIHCMWVFPKKNLGKGFGTLLIGESIREAKEKGFSGVAVLVSEGSWMAGKTVYEKNGFERVQSKGRFDLMVKKFNTSPDPEIRNWEIQLDQYQGLHLLYANQCPLFIKSVDEMKATAKKYGIDLNVTIIDTPQKAQHSPSGYGVYNLVYNGKLLADHYISNTRFQNILNKELK